MKVIITGASGFVGTNLLPYLSNNFDLYGVYRNAPRSERYHRLLYSTLSSADLDNAHAFIHLAGKSHDLKHTANIDDYYEVNTDLTIKLFDKFLKSSCKQFIFVSSVKAAADNVETILTENTSPSPSTHYGKSKLEAEKYILDQSLPEEKKVYILRPCMIHGPHNKGNLNLLYKLISQGIPYPLGKYQNKRSFLSIENFCFIMQEILKQNIDSGVYNMSDNEPISTIELVSLIGDTINRPVKILHLPKILISLLANTGNALKLPFNNHRLNKLVESYVVSNSKIKTNLGIELPLSTREGLIKTIKSL